MCPLLARAGLRVPASGSGWPMGRFQAALGISSANAATEKSRISGTEKEHSSPRRTMTGLPRNDAECAWLVVSAASGVNERWRNAIQNRYSRQGRRRPALCGLLAVENLRRALPAGPE